MVTSMVNHRHKWPTAVTMKPRHNMWTASTVSLQPGEMDDKMSETNSHLSKELYVVSSLANISKLSMRVFTVVCAVRLLVYMLPYSMVRESVIFLVDLMGVVTLFAEMV